MPNITALRRTGILLGCLTAVTLVLAIVLGAPIIWLGVGLLALGDLGVWMVFALMKNGRLSQRP